MSFDSPYLFSNDVFPDTNLDNPTRQRLDPLVDHDEQSLPVSNFSTLD